ncbi:hypothetical protein [Shewanella sp. TC10]|uniref:hypothetical protein n=1 Tax=Shewanella sp. TC10 TaxID=1419739 RepID=UPI00129ED634|nr:hypothetical protein [Shewanella sp. TC10]
MKITKYSALALCSLPLLVSTSVSADNQINDDLIVVGSACLGQDCVNGESFGFDTLRLKENNLRIKFQDTSTSASFPSNDWQITANDSENGGANKFSIDDITGGRTPFTIEASAPSHSLYVDDGGRIGVGTSTPVVEMHVVNGDSPTLRLEQNGSSGFTAQTWDIAGNETNFFVRDVTNGSKLPFRIKTGAPKNSIFINSDGGIGLGTEAPKSQLHVYNSSDVNNSTPFVLLENAHSTLEDQLMLKMVNKNGDVRLEFENETTGVTWRITNDSDKLSFSKVGSGKVEFIVDGDGNVTTSGDITFIDNGVSTTISSLVDRIESLEN